MSNPIVQLVHELDETKRKLNDLDCQYRNLALDYDRLLDEYMKAKSVIRTLNEEIERIKRQ